VEDRSNSAAQASAAPAVRRWSGPKRALAIAALAGVYTVLGVVSLNPPWGHAAVGRIVWPAGGVAMAALLLWGRWLWPAIFIGAALTTQFTGGAPLHVLATGIGNALEAWLAVRILESAGFDRRLERVSDVGKFVAAGFAGAILSAAFGVLGLYLTDGAPVRALQRIAWLWTIGHSMGSIIVAPLLLTIGGGIAFLRANRRVAEAIIVLGFLVAVGSTAFGMDTSAPLEYLPFPLLIWAAIRFRSAGAAAANLILSGIALLWTALGWGPFALRSMTYSYLFTWCYANVTAVTSMLLAAIVAEGKAAEAARQRREDEYRLLIEQAADGVVILGPDGQLQDVNSSACEMLGRPRAELLAAEITSLLAPACRAAAKQQIVALRAGSAAMFEWQLAGPGGVPFPAEVSAKRFPDHRIQAFIRDITERKDLEEQLLRSKKMEAVGMLAGGLAHEFNNILTVILNHSWFAQESLPPKSRAAEDVEYVIRAAERATKLTRGILTFARRQPVDTQHVILRDLIAELETTIRRLLGPQIELVLSASGDPWWIKADPAQIEQVVVNIVINACDAMPAGGRLFIDCANHLAGPGGNGAAAELAPGEYIRLRIRDTGAGMDEKTLSRIFEPFFTTKRGTDATGLGLAVSSGIIEQAGGRIAAQSRPGEGATFDIYLPRAAKPETAPQPARKPGTDELPPVTVKTVLLIEDEPAVRELVLEVLEGWGHTVLVAISGEQAIEIAGAQAGEIEIVISDIVLPGISGPAAVQQIRRIVPGVPVLYVSGYSEEQISPAELRAAGTGFLAKPFKPSELASAVRKVLSGGASVPTAGG
jgi:PAS domain S-box-containing protein